MNRLARVDLAKAQVVLAANSLKDTVEAVIVVEQLGLAKVLAHPPEELPQVRLDAVGAQKVVVHAAGGGS
eukprot:CAMPEP_0185306276 /NCGR_PEP_ID=MMETSP1363-20130426/15980_1 /TAXON_ID=38817 /ORGANISM="Gephyrocapsa oceanica, Strain RCC1303" /LENGTH=69 /DNA_ID=CAMNT_0027903553 /DNA_START=204 /DNA_END=413 /DNA_ORIENTATION=+